MANAPRPRSALPELLLAGALLTASSAGAADAVLRAEITEPRAYGHTLGDVLQRRVVLEAAAPWTLDEKSLPAPGRAGAWLEVLPARVEAEHGAATTRYTLTLAYQLTNSPRGVTTLLLPEVELKLRSGEAEQAHLLPDAPFTAGPLTPDTILARGPLDEMQPDIAPAPIDTRAARTRLAGYGLLAAGLLAWLGYRLWGIPWLARTRGPFARALPEVKRLAHRRGEDAAREALLRLHRAFDESAGQAMFAEQVPGFLAGRPRFAALGEPIGRFFRLSREAFFAGGAPPADALPWLVQLCRDCRDAERGLS